MPEVETLPDALLDELKDLHNAEKRLTKALPKWIKIRRAASRFKRE